MKPKDILAEELKIFIQDNGEEFERRLLSEAVNVSGNIKDILNRGNIDLLQNARKLIYYIVDRKEDDLVSFAQQEGVAWAWHSLTLALKLEWVQAIRRTLWHII